MTPCPATAPSADHPSAPVSRKSRTAAKPTAPPRSLVATEHVPEAPRGLGPSAGDLSINTPEGVQSVHGQRFAVAGSDGSNGQLLFVLVARGVKRGTTVSMPIRHTLAAKAGKNGAFLRVGMPGGPTLAAANQRAAENSKLCRDAGPQAPYAAQSPVESL